MSEKRCIAFGCHRHVWDGDDYCAKCREEMAALGIRRGVIGDDLEPKNLHYWLMIGAMVCFVALFVWGWLWIGGAR